jgi:site-specific recombinase XerD
MAVTEITRNVPTVAQAIERFIAKHQHERGVKEHISILQGARSGRVVGKRAAGVTLANSHLGPLRFDRPDSDDFVAWLHQRFPSHLAPSTFKKGRSTLRQLLVFAIANRWADESVLASLPSAPPSEPRTEWLRPEVLAALNPLVTPEHFTSHQRFMWFCLQNTGMRPAELVVLKPEALNRTDGTLAVVGKGRGAGKRRDIPISDAFKSEWDDYVTEHQLRPTSWLFPVMRVRFVPGERLSYEHEVADASRHCTPKPVRTTVTKVRELAVEAVAKKRLSPELLPSFALSPKVLRRTYACTHLIMASELGAGYGMDIRSLQDAMGHESLETTAMYLSDVSAYLNRLRRPISITDAVVKLTAQSAAPIAADALAA